MDGSLAAVNPPALEGVVLAVPSLFMCGFSFAFHVFSPTPQLEDCLKEYVSTDDGAFRWHVTTRVIAGDGWKGSVLEMTSQRWLPNLVTPDTWSLG